MGWRLFIDDEREPPVGSGFVVARSVPEAITLIEARGAPCYISFDNDLGQELEGHHLARWIVRRDMDLGGAFLAEDFDFFVHSQNVPAAANIDGLLRNYLDKRA